MVAQKNIIKKVDIRVNAPSHQNGMQLKDGLDTFFKEKIFPEMDDYFNSIQKNHSKIIRIKNISIEINIKETDSINNIKELIINNLKSKIKKNDFIQNNSENIQIVTSDQNEAEAFCYFLEHGSFPWWFEASATFWDKISRKIHFGNGNSKKLKTLLSNAAARKRLIFQFTDAQIFSIVFPIVNPHKKLNGIPRFPKKYRNEFWESLLQVSLSDNKQKTVEILRAIPFAEVKKLQSTASKIFDLHLPIDRLEYVNTDIQKKEAENTGIPEKTDDLNVFGNNSKNKKEGIFIKNAGLILLHPFLKMFFEKLGFLSEKKIIPEKIDEAVHVLHYLSTGKERAYEHELGFEKFICNVPFQQPINRHVSLSKNQKVACEILLQAVLEYWSVLKSNSTKIIQNEFLQREGKLILSEEKHTLIVERKTHDILLDKLPWNIHLIKIPWKHKIIFVEW